MFAVQPERHQSSGPSLTKDLVGYVQTGLEEVGWIGTGRLTGHHLKYQDLLRIVHSKWP